VQPDYDKPGWFCNLMFLRKEKGDNSVWIPRFQYHYLTRAQWDNLVTRVECWYDSISEEEIEALNVPLDIEREEMAGDYIQERATRGSPKLPKKPEPGHIYLLAGGDSLFKIGITRHPKTRMDTLSKSCPWPVTVELLEMVPDPCGLELFLKEHFASKKSNGEWYQLDTKDVEYVKGLANG